MSVFIYGFLATKISREKSKDSFKKGSLREGREGGACLPRPKTFSAQPPARPVDFRTPRGIEQRQGNGTPPERQLLVSSTGIKHLQRVVLPSGGRASLRRQFATSKFLLRDAWPSRAVVIGVFHGDRMLPEPRLPLVRRESIRMHFRHVMRRGISCLEGRRSSTHLKMNVSLHQSGHPLQETPSDPNYSTKSNPDPDHI